MHKTIIFDFDGTLADCKELHQLGFRQAVHQQFPLADWDDALLEGLPTKRKISVLKVFGVVPDAARLAADKASHTMSNLADWITPRPDIVELISLLRGSYSVCLATNATRPFVVAALDIMGLSESFDYVVTASDALAKPSPEMYIRCMTVTGNTPENTIVFEDSPLGIAAAELSGADVRAVRDVADTLTQARDLL